ncbi:MAG: phosphohistidine phosphatase [Planctomycetaceae bacterium]|nr:phosphohistidine phosphatase [Planctomycetaceae bacterium]
MLVWLVRHAVAADRDEFNGPDEVRPLTDKGRRQFRSFVKWLETQGAPPAVILTSPLVRAVETAEILRKGMGLKKKDVVESVVLGPGAEPRALLEAARQTSAATVALVGHEPDLSAALASFVGGGQFDFDKGFVAAVEFSGDAALGGGRLCRFVGPKLRAAE